jgi:serine/threonine protein kinase
MNPPSQARACPKCGDTSPAADLGGLCPGCLAGLAFSTGTGAGKSALAGEAEPSPSHAEGADDRIGPYRLVEPLGEGGCGVVYLAEQEQPLRRQVALKVIKLGMDTRQVIARFEAERQALARMDHPNIAKVFDAGATETGRPYFVMELVRGTRITDFCDDHGLSVHERLELLIQVCQAVEHAHERGIVHRDLKPSNILVMAKNGAATPKVIDFGIAKATTAERLTDKTLFTAFEQFLGTPAYMSPEQAGLGAAIDRQSDVYSLGVLLYEMLTGSPPFEGVALAGVGLDELRRVIREEDPAMPSTRVSELGKAELRGIAQRRNIPPRELAALLRGDLDRIVLKCLEKDPARRYSRAQTLAEDLGRYLRGEPVQARPVSRAERFWRKCRRHPALASMAVSLAVTLAALLIALGILFRQHKAPPQIPKKVPLQIFVMDGTTHDQKIVGPGSNVAVDPNTDNYWSARLWRTTEHGSGLMIRDGRTDEVLNEPSLGLSKDCPAGIALDPVNRVAWVTGQCGTNNDSVWVVNMDNLTNRQPIRCGGINGGLSFVNPATGRFYHETTAGPQRIDLGTFALKRTAFGIVVGVNVASNILYALASDRSQSNVLQIIDGRPDPEKNLTNVPLPFKIDGSVGVDEEHCRVYVPNLRSNIVLELNGITGAFVREIRLPEKVKSLRTVAVDTQRNRIYILAAHNQAGQFDHLYILDDGQQTPIPLLEAAHELVLNPALDKVYLWFGDQHADDPDTAP